MMKINNRQVKQGDIYWVSLNPTKGHEQQGRRSVLVVSNDIINSKLVLALIVPITTTNCNIPLHVLIPNEYSTKGYIKCEEIRAVDLTHRNAEYVVNCREEKFFKRCLAIIEGLF
ncbi:type II toxin-antitoxin system PemK/MazF family toxin [Clostridiaceae bacterium HSG29]|nr:type II toxin-antitoxin system PemK/MazF family toxin [Clostridiaceae bacterium HSG29]